LAKIEVVFGFWLFRNKNGRSSKTSFEDVFKILCSTCRGYGTAVLILVPREGGSLVPSAEEPKEPKQEVVIIGKN